MINQRITKLRQLMKERGIDLYIIPTSDFHQSEYVGSYFEARHYMSGFSGSAGTLIVREDEAYLWTDGRYFIQAEKQLQDSGITLYRVHRVFLLLKNILKNIQKQPLVLMDA